MKLIDRRNVLSGAAAGLSAAVTGKVWAAGSTQVRHLVEIRRFAFVPDVLDVRVGDTIVWVNRDLVPHTANSRDGGWDTGPINTGEEAEVLVFEDMSQDYFCAFHPVMKGKIRL